MRVYVCIHVFSLSVIFTYVAFFKVWESASEEDVCVQRHEIIPAVGPGPRSLTSQVGYLDVVWGGRARSPR